MQLRDTKDLNQLTAKLGLTLNESEVYFFLVRNGLVRGADIYLQLGLDKSSCYRALASLQNKGLVHKVGEERNQTFGANHPDFLLGVIDQKKQELEQAETTLTRYIQSLKENLGSQYLDKNVTVIEGEEGYKLYIEGRLRCKNKLIRDLSGRISGSSFFDDYDSYMKGYISRRVKVGIWLNQLVPYGEMDDKWDRSSKEMYKEARELPKGFEPNAVMSTWDDKSAFISKEGKSIIGFVVKDRLITAMMNSMFDFLWERVKN